ncbi:MAG: ABC transporter substrate-binding protein [Oscillospiraceae bacterium]|jgi:multiple sugar transport system substrate-binding protein|nr:ABC transporter substrate-binding protein [Oscillospiraceae bacterium]
MKNKLKRTLAALAALTMVFTASCNNDGDREERTTNADHQGLIDAVSRLTGHEALPDVKVDKKLKWLSWWEIDETQGAAELFRQVYGVPAQKNDDDKSIIEWWNVSYAARYEELGKRISSGDSPDIFQFEVENYPYSVYANLFQTIDGVIDLSAPEWADSLEAIEMFKWGGNNYCAITELVPSYFLWYRKSILEGAGLEDPYALYKAGLWDWDKFLDMCASFTDPVNDKYAVSGWNPDNSLICTTGVGLISLEGGKLVNNMYDGRIERAMDLVSILCQRDYRYPHHILSDWSMNVPEWRSGNILFWDNGQWFYSETLYKMRDKDNWADDEICLVPYPRDPYSDKYYQKMKQDSYMLCSGSKNVDGYKAWIQCNILTVREPEVVRQARNKRNVDYGWTDAQLDILEETVRELVPVFDFKNGIGEDIGGTQAYELPVEKVTKYVYVHGEQTYTQLRSEVEGEINARLRELNASVGQ